MPSSIAAAKLFPALYAALITFSEEFAILRGIPNVASKAFPLVEVALIKLSKADIILSS